MKMTVNLNKFRKNSVRRVTHLLGALIQIFIGTLDLKDLDILELFKLEVIAVEVITYAFLDLKFMEGFVLEDGLDPIKPLKT